MTRRALIGADIFDGQKLHGGMALLRHGDVFAGLCPTDAIPPGFQTQRLPGGTLLPGFVDLQVNGGGGVMFNDDTSRGGLTIIAKAHASTGTRAFLPTLITDTPQKTRAAVDAVAEAIADNVPGIIGIHLEGPHLSVARKGAHDPALIRRMEDSDLAFLIDAAQRLPNVMVTVAPENVSLEQITQLSRAGVIVSLGHTDCTFDEAQAAFGAGARCVTHLFNAMSQMGSRAPGLVGAALQAPGVSAGLIADNIHVHAATIRIACAAKQAPGQIFLVTDAMATVGSDIAGFTLNGRRVLRQNGRLTLQDGTLAGADLDMPSAVSVLTQQVGRDRQTAYAMATAYPAAVLANSLGYGAFTAGQRWNGIYLDANGQYSTLHVQS